MPAGLVDFDTFAFADGNAGHVCDLGSAPAVGALDVLCVNSDTVVTMPAGFSLARQRVANQGAYLWFRKAVGGEGSTVTVTTSGNFNAQVSWSRWSGVDAFDQSALGSADASAGSTTPAATTPTLAAPNELVVAFGAIHGAVTSSPSWSAGYTPLTAVTQGTGASTATGYVAYRTDAGTAPESPNVSWTTPAPDRYMLVATFTATAAQSVNAGQASDTHMALPASAAKTLTAGMAAETDTALPAQTATKTLTAGLATDAEMALPARVVKTITAGLATDTSTTHPATAAKAIAAGLAVETGTAPAPAVRKHLTAGQAAETDMAPAALTTKAVRTGLPTETDTVHASTARKIRRAGIAVETDTAPHATAGELIDITVRVSAPYRAWGATAPARAWSVSAPTT